MSLKTQGSYYTDFKLQTGFSQYKETLSRNGSYLA